MSESAKHYVRFLKGFTFIVVLVCGCSDVKESAPEIAKEIDAIVIDIPSKTVELSALTYKREVSLWTLDGQTYSGYGVANFDNGQVRQKFGIVDGRKEGIAQTWYEDGHLRIATEYHEGKMDGSKQSWSPDSTHVLLAQLNYSKGKGHGVQKKWYASGEPYLIMNLNMGKEEGMQKAFRKNGDLYANYEAKEGRIFGMKKAALCFGIEDEVVNYEGD